VAAATYFPLNFYEKLWKYPGPIKSKIVLWLALNNKLLTWDNGLKRGWNGPNRCALCKEDAESVFHLFIFCSYAVQVWKMLADSLKPSIAWESENLERSFEKWEQDNSVKSYAAFPSLLVSDLWWARNQAIFQDTFTPPEVTAGLIQKWSQ